MNLNSLCGKILQNRFEVLSLAGSGGMGVVFKARDLELDRFVALKLLKPFAAQNAEEARKRFEREAKAISLLSHKHIAKFYSYGILENEWPFIAMEYLKGSSLGDLIATEKKLATERCVNIAIQICDALNAAHENGIIHRDLKPENIFVLSDPEPDFVKLIDFGLARIDDCVEAAKQRLTATGQMLGTVFYLSPEQCLFQQADERSDIYALACILYQLLCGEPPFLDDNQLHVIHKHASQKPVSLTSRGASNLPAALEEIVFKCLEKDPALRYQNMLSLKHDLEIVARKEGTQISFSRQSQNSTLKISNKPELLVALFLLAGAVIGLIVYSLFFSSSLAVRARASLVHNRTVDNAYTWWVQADKLARNGKNPRAAESAKQQIFASMGYAPNDWRNAADFYLALAKKLREKGDTAAAQECAFKSLKTMELAILHDEPQRTILLPEIETICGILSQSSETLNREQSKYIEQVGRLQASYYRDTTQLNLLDLVHTLFVQKQIKRTEELAKTLQVRDVHLLLNKDKRLEKSFEETNGLILQFYGAGSPVQTYYLWQLAYESVVINDRPQARHWLNIAMQEIRAQSIVHRASSLPLFIKIIPLLKMCNMHKEASELQKILNDWTEKKGRQP